MNLDTLRDAGIELLEHVRDCVVVLDNEAAEAVRWNVGFIQLVNAGASNIHVVPSVPAVTSSRFVVVLGKPLHECQKSMSFLLRMTSASSVSIFSIYSDEENLEITSQEYGFERFTQHCRDLLRSAGVTKAKLSINQLFVRFFESTLISGAR